MAYCIGPFNVLRFLFCGKVVCLDEETEIDSSRPIQHGSNGFPEDLLTPIELSRNEVCTGLSVLSRQGSHVPTHFPENYYCRYQLCLPIFRV